MIDHFKNAMEEDDKEFVYNEEEVLTVNITDAPTDGWIIEPSAEPCIVSQSTTNIMLLYKCVLYTDCMTLD